MKNLIKKNNVIFLLLFMSMLAMSIFFISACNINAETKKYTVTYLATQGGRIDGVTEQQIEEGESTDEVYAVPNEGYEFVKWSDGITEAARRENNVYSNIAVTAEFKRLVYTIRYLATDGGAISGITSQSVNYCESAETVTAVPNNGYKFVKWSDGLTEATRQENDVAEDITLTAIFEKFTYNLSYVAGEGGYLIGNVNQSILYGENGTTVTAIPNDGYKFVKWSDGETKDTRCDTEINSAISVTAEFEFLFAGGEGTQINPYKIETYSQLLNMRYYPDKDYLLIRDLNLSGIAHEPIFDANEYFTGKFYGGGKTIKNLIVATESNFPSLFGMVFGGVIENFSLENVSIITIDFNTEEEGMQYYVGTVAGYLVGLITDVIVSGNITVNGLSYDGVAIGGLVGMANGTINNCISNVLINAKNVLREHKTNTTLPYLLGGMVGVCDSAHIRNCNVQGEINVTDSCYDIYIGGLTAYYFTDRQVETEINDSHTNVVINGYLCNIGGFIGYLEVLANTSLQVTDSSVHGNISGADVGGFIYNGYSYGNVLIENCFVENEIITYSGAAGFIDRFTEQVADCTIRNCYASSIIATSNPNAGGSAWGFAYSVSHINFINCFSSGSVSSYRGGGFGFLLSRCYVERCYSDSDIYSYLSSSAFVYGAANSEIINSYSQNNFINEIDQNKDATHTALGLMRGSKLQNFYYSGNAIDKVVRTIDNSEIINVHCLKNDKLTSESIEENDGITIYEKPEDMYFIADLLNNGLTEEVWENRDNGFPEFKIV